MRKVITVLVLAISMLAVTSAATADPPECGDSCPHVQ